MSVYIYIFIYAEHVHTYIHTYIHIYIHFLFTFICTYEISKRYQGHCQDLFLPYIRVLGRLCALLEAAVIRASCPFVYPVSVGWQKCSAPVARFYANDR